MIDANRNASREVLQQHKQLSYERFRTQFAEGVEQKLIDFEMTWDDLAKKLQWLWNKYQSKTRFYTGVEVKEEVRDWELTMEKMNDIAHVFSTEPYILLRPRLPWVQS